MDRSKISQRPGQNLSEYALILGLVVLISLGALMLFANNLANLGQNMLALITPNGGGAVTAGGGDALGIDLPGEPTTGETATGPDSQQTVQFSYDPATGTFTFSGDDGGTDGTVATSAQGVELAIKGLEELLANPTLNDGTPIENAVAQGLLDDLIRHANQMHQYQLELDSGKTRGQTNEWLSGEHTAFQENYASLAALVGDNPEYSNLLAQVADYSGIISTITAYEYEKPYYTTDSWYGGAYNDYYAEIDDIIVGTNIAYNDVNVNVPPACQTEGTCSLIIDQKVSVDSDVPNAQDGLKSLN